MSHDKGCIEPVIKNIEDLKTLSRGPIRYGKDLLGAGVHGLPISRKSLRKKFTALLKSRAFRKRELFGSFNS